MTQAIKTIAKTAGTIYFDASCGLCSAAARRLQNLVGHRFALTPLQAPGAANVLNLQPPELFDEIKLRQPDGRILGGVDALVEISRHIWWTYPFWLASYVPGMLPLARIGYRIVAKHRRQISRSCGLETDQTFFFQSYFLLLQKQQI